MNHPFSPESLRAMAGSVQSASRSLARQPTSARNDALVQMASSLRRHTDEILQANQRDVEKARTEGRDDAFVDRLILDTDRIESMAQAVEEIAGLPDPLGGFDEVWTRPNGLQVARRRIPLGVIGIIYESRPNVTSDAAALCIKSGNGVVLKGGSDAFSSNQAIVTALREGLRNSSLDTTAREAIGFVDTTDRDAVSHLLTFSDAIDVVIPRGGKGLIRFVHEHSRIPVIKHDDGVCHIVVDGSADPDDVEAILLNAKVQRPGVCNAMETLLVLSSATDQLPRILTALSEAGVRLHLCPESIEVARDLELPRIGPADDAAYAEEFLSLELAVRVVPTLTDAVSHIDRFGSSHTEALLTNDLAQSQRFIDEVDSAVVLINASTRFSDGGQLGLGAEIGISTTRMHAYGPMGLRELTTTKFVVVGKGQIRT